ncbi:hypothetical protein MATR_08620 [Marivirga tractuosa]|uniref:Uncharacterized protein n=1 Tax=Marivirga tractuosa (strain ATCC 23168 / DSM 4126 / NBRC 15989 / NCIMB 1408 / VKM B-1430 / H-43) TaxID=643867 RepID=E4TPC1_MARTH|nr:hypothetical protein [Marivirga tractuosa]ADR21509.1 hypothetical protein Ftrac_1519 [Marivirga tractuosa DSM 4126]BDD14037.1 hypothetical protein MATR_08620 [Marivirga tractuosa]
MRNHLYLFFVLLIGLESTIVFGQSKYQNGYVVTNQKDTIYGQLRDRSPEPFGKIFKKVRMKGFWIFETRFGPDDLKSYKIGNDIYQSIWYDSYSKLFSIFHVSIPGQGEKVFMRLAVGGEVNLYWDEYRDADSGYEMEIPFFKRAESQELIRVTQGILGLKQKHLANLFADCPSLVNLMKKGFFDTPEEMANYFNEKCN